MDLKSQINKQAQAILPELIEIRRHLHRHPELSFKEFETQKYIRKQLEALGLQAEDCAGTGLVAIIPGKNKKVTYGLRADIDALPIKEANAVAYCSQNEGVMHACGHDVHTTCLLGAIKILVQHQGQLENSIKVVFQPGEEKLPGGASLMIKDGVLKNPEVKNMLGQHVMPLIPAGKVGFRKGLYMASADEIYMRIKGKGGHAAHPHETKDPVAAMAQVITALQQVVSRKAKPSIPSVLSFGKIIANGATNIIPDEVYIEGTFRTFDEAWRMNAHKEIEQIATQTAAAFGVEAEVDIHKGYPFLKNDTDLTTQAQNWAVEYLGEENVEDLDIWPAGEDFAYYSQEVPSCFYRLGIRNEAKGITSMLHTPTFDIDEQALETGSGLMAFLAIKNCNEIHH